MTDENKTAENEPQPTERRNFIRGSALTAGALAASGIAANASAATLNEKYEVGAVQRKTLDIAFHSQKISAYDVNRVLEQVLEFCGCPSCGFNGYDIRFRIDPIVQFKSETPAFATLR